MSKLTDEIKNKISADYHTNKYSQRELAKRHSVSVGTINNITKGVVPINEHLVEKEFNANCFIEKYGLSSICIYLLGVDVAKEADKINDIIVDYKKSKLVVLRQFRLSNSNEKLIFLDNNENISDYQLMAIWEASNKTQLCGSNGEIKIEKYLQDRNIEYKREYIFELLDKKRFDFYLPLLNTCIEFDGKQHFEPIDFFGGVDSFVENKNRDKIKNDFCLKQNIKLIRIPYYHYHKIEVILDKGL